MGTREEQLNSKLDYLSSTKLYIKQALENMDVEVASDLPFRDYADLIESINSGDVMLFATKQEMLNYDNPKEGMLSLVYNSTTQDLDENLIRYVIFKDTAVMSEQINNNYYTSLQSVTDYNLRGEATLSPTGMQFNYRYLDGTQLNIEYTSMDGITYNLISEIQNPIDLGEVIDMYMYNHINYFYMFMEIEQGSFNGIYKYTNNTYIPISTQLTLTNSNQILTDYTGYGNTDIVTGDGSYISNIKNDEYMAKYLPVLQDRQYSAAIIQNGTTKGTLEFVQRKKIKVNDAFTSEFNSADCIVQMVEDNNKIEVPIDNEYTNTINNYLNAQSKYNYSFIMGGNAYRVYLGFNYTTKEQWDTINQVYKTVPYQMTSLYAFILNLEDLSIFRSFVNTDTWTFTDNGFGNLLTYAYSSVDDCLVLLTDMNGWYSTDGAYIGLTKIQVDGTRTTTQHNLQYASDYSYKGIEYTSFDLEQNCYYLAYKSISGTASSIKRIIKMTPDGSHSSIFETTETMSYINVLWTTYFKSIGSLIYYKTETDGAILRNLHTGEYINLYGSLIYSSTVFGLDNDNIYVSHKKNVSDEFYNVCQINMNTMSVTTIPNTTSDNRLQQCFYLYNRNLCIFMDKKIISLDGVILDHFIPQMLSNVSISGIDRVDDYIFRASFMDYNLVISSNKFTAYKPIYKYYNYQDINTFPVENNICIISPSVSSTTTNDKSKFLKYRSIPITAVQDNAPELEAELLEATAISEVIKG